MIISRWPTICLIALVIVTTLMFSVSRVAAGPVTNASPVGSAPYTRLGIYQQALDVVDATGTMLRFGESGRNIYGTSDIIFRPSIMGTNNSAVTMTNGVAVKKNGTSANLYIPGQLCLYDHTTGYTMSCKDKLEGGPASSKWKEEMVNYNGWYSYHVLTPNPVPADGLTPGVQLGTSGNRLISRAVDLDGDRNVLAINLGSGYAADFVGSVLFNRDVNIYGTIKIGGHEPWYKEFDFIGHEGQGSGLDADLINGNQATIESAASCDDDPTDTVPHVACLCFSIKYAWVLDNDGNQPDPDSPVKYCMDLANRS